jgi:hypothetical protein
MKLSIPEYLREADIQDKSIRYEWDDWKTIPAAEEPDEKLVARLEGVSQRAVLAFACGTAEWLVYRFGTLCDDRAPWDFLAAAWAMIIDVRYCGYGDATGWQEYSLKRWNGPVKRPIQDGLKLLEIACQQLAWEFRTDPTAVTGTISALTTYVMTDPAPYKKWSQRVLKRFDSLYPRDKEDPLGDVVPREAVDPAYHFKVSDTEALINQFLSSLDRRSNKFLSDPKGMLEKLDDDPGFDGKPYVFAIEHDRATRRIDKSHHHDD